MNDVLPMTEMFRVCSQVLDDSRCPLHYRELTRLALRRMNRDEHHVDFGRQVEDVRQKMLEAGRHETFYAPKPLCLGAKREWFSADGQQLLIAPDLQVEIPPSIPAAIEGATEAILRSPHMVQKKKYARPEVVARARAGGLVIEALVKSYFRREWPDAFVPPDNDGQVERWCDHDFKLRINGAVLKFDVANPSLDGEWRVSEGKRSTDFHLRCRLREGRVVWESIVPGALYASNPRPWLLVAPLRLVVRLNCEKHGVDYALISNAR